jgi:formate-dependent nitrite reductase membrane component NrfD
MKTALSFAWDFGTYAIKGGRMYYAWLLFLAFFILVGSYTAYIQLTQGLIVTGATDQVTLESFFANFVFTAHVAAAAVLVVAPGYFYHRKDLKELAVMGEIIAMVFVATGITFVIFHMGRPDRTWHIIPGLGHMNFPNSMLSFDTIVLNVYLVLNLIGVSYILFKKYVGTFHEKQLAIWFRPIVFLAIAWGPLIHIVTAFVLASNARMGMWSTAVLPFAFLSMAGASGPALVVVIFLLTRKYTDLEIGNPAIDLMTTIIAWSLGILMLVLAAETFTLLYPSTEHADSLVFNMFGHKGLNHYVPWFWGVIIALVVSFIALLFRKVRHSYDRWLPLTCLVVFFAILIEKPMILVFPSFSPSPLGEYTVYHVTLVEFFNVLFVWAIGFMSLTLILKGAIGILTGQVRHHSAPAITPEAVQGGI